MSRRFQIFAFPLAAALGMTLALPSLAASSASSSVSDSIGASVGSISTSVEKSSRSSTKAVAQIDGDYTVTAVAAVAEKPGMLRLALHAKDSPSDEDDLFLYVPAATVAKAQIQVGLGVTATPRAYGTEFAKTEGKQAFFLVLKDEWARELNSQRLEG